MEEDNEVVLKKAHPPASSNEELVIRVTRTLVVSANIPLKSYGDLSADEALAYERSMHGEDAWDQIQALVALADPKDISAGVRAELRLPSTYNG